MRAKDGGSKSLTAFAIGHRTVPRSQKKYPLNHVKVKAILTALTILIY